MCYLVGSHDKFHTKIFTRLLVADNLRVYRVLQRVPQRHKPLSRVQLTFDVHVRKQHRLYVYSLRTRIPCLAD